MCQRTGRKISKAAPELHPVLVVSPWHHIDIDFIGPLTPNKEGCCYILTISDYFNKFVYAYAMTSKHAFGIASALFKVCNIIHMHLCVWITIFADSCHSFPIYFPGRFSCCLDCPE